MNLKDKRRIHKRVGTLSPRVEYINPLEKNKSLRSKFIGGINITFDFATR